MSNLHLDDPIAEINREIRWADQHGDRYGARELRAIRDDLIRAECQQAAQAAPEAAQSNRWEDHVDWGQGLTEDVFWQAVADANGLDVSEIADGDIVDWI